MHRLKLSTANGTRLSLVKPSLRILALRLKPGQDLRRQLESFVKEQRIKAGFLITTVGSLRQASIRLADQPGATDFTGKFEIVSLVGTLGQDGIHLISRFRIVLGRQSADIWLRAV